MLLAALSTGHKIGLAVVGGAFILFALTSSFVLPRKRPDFPGKNGLSVFILVCFVFFFAMLTAVDRLRRRERGQGRGEAGRARAPAPAHTVAVSETEFKIALPAAKVAGGQGHVRGDERRQDPARPRGHRPGRLGHRRRRRSSTPASPRS